jgi:predicted HTH transcriptional regulator
VNKELYQNYLARNLSPSINFSFEEIEIDGKRLVVLLIPPAEGVPTAFRENSIVVTIPFNRIHQVGKKLGNNNAESVLIRKPLNERRKRIISEMRDNPNVTKAELQKILGISGTAIDNNIAYLRKNGYIERIGSRRGGY